MSNSFDDLRELAKTSLSAYAAVMHHDWAPNWHHRVIARALERMAAREPGWDRLIISMPPRAGKSELISKMFPGWYMATHPHENVIVATYGSELADDLGRKAREYASTELFESIMGTSVSNDTNAITKWELKNRSSFFATSVGGALTGRGAHCFVKGTRVRVIGGTTPIEEIEVGDSVLSHGADGLEMRDVVAVKRSKGVGIYRITTASGRVVEATGDHPFFVQGEGYIPASLLTSGDMLLCCVREGHDYVRMVERVRETETVYDIQVEGNHNFFANDILVHNCLIIDDPVKNREEAESEGAMEKTYSWFTSTAYTRLERGGRVLIVMTRWNDLDLAGRLLASNSGWKEIAFPAIAEVDEEYRKAGEPLWPDKYPLEQLHKIRTTIGRRDWASLYQQRPAPEDGNIFKSEWFKEYRLPNGMIPSTHNDIYSQAGLSGLGIVSGVYQSWDTAVSAKQTSARSACTTWAVLDNKFYLLDAYAEPLSFPELRAKAMQKYEQWKPDIIFVEEQQTGRPLIDELKRTLGERLVPVRLRGNKETRAKAASVAFETGRVLIPSPQDAPWVDSYTNELMSFPSGRFADRVDSTSQALVKLLKDSNPRSSFKGAMSDLAENYFKAPLRSIYAR